MTSETTPADDAPSPERPVYRKVPHRPPSSLWMIICDEGWRSSIVGDCMYEWAADWLLGVIGRQPFAPGRH